MEMLDLPKSRVLAVGDALRTDIAGAAAFGVDSCWVLGGLHGDHLGDDPAEIRAEAETRRPLARWRRSGTWSGEMSHFSRTPSDHAWPGSCALPSAKPPRSSKPTMSARKAGLPHSITRSSSGPSGGRPRSSVNSLVEHESAPARNGSRVTVG